MLVIPLNTPRPVHEQEWGLLIAQTAQGDQEALATLYDQTSPQVYGLVLKILDNREAAEEVTLDVYTQVWRQAQFLKVPATVLDDLCIPATITEPKLALSILRPRQRPGASCW